MISFFFLLLPAQEALTQTIAERQPVITIANQGLFYFLHSALQESTFTSKLKPEERKMADLLYEILDLASMLRWFNENKIPSFPTKVEGRPAYTYAYVDHTEKVARYTTLANEAPQIIFSEERNRFMNLKPEEGERAAMTTAEFISPIEINLYRLNAVSKDKKDRFDLGTATTLLVHEYGHKLGSLKNQAAIDSLAVKLGDLVRGLTNAHPLSDGTMIYSIYMNRFKFKDWMGFEDPLMKPQNGKILLTNLPIEPTLSQGPRGLSIFANQGLFVWSEKDLRTTDITKAVLDPLTKRDLLNWNPENAELYKFTKHTMYSVNSFQVNEVTPGQPVFKSSMTQVEVVLPFMIPGVSKDPKQIEFHKRFFWSSGRYIFQPQSVTAQYRIKDTRFELINKEERSIVSLDFPHYNTELISTRKEGNTLIVEIKVQGQKHLLANEGTQFISFLQAEAAIKSGDTMTWVRSVSFDLAKEVFTFKINNLDQLPTGRLTIEQISLRPAHLQIASDSFYAKAEVPLFNPIDLKFENEPIGIKTSKFQFATISFKPNRTTTRAIWLQFISNEHLRSLELTLNFKKSSFMAVETADHNERLDRKQTDNVTYEYTADLILSAKDLTQTLRNGVLEVQIDLSHFGSLFSKTPLDGNIQGVQFYKVALVHPEIALKNLIATTNSLQQVQVRLETPAVLHLTTHDLEYETNKKLLQSPKFTNFLNRMCRGLF